MVSIYTLPKQKLIELLNGSKKLTSLSTFFILAELKNLIELKKEEEEKIDSTERVKTSFSASTITEMFTQLNIQNNSFAQEQKKLLDEYRPEVTKNEVLLPVRNFTVKLLLIIFISNSRYQSLFTKYLQKPTKTSFC